MKIEFQVAELRYLFLCFQWAHSSNSADVADFLDWLEKFDNREKIEKLYEHFFFCCAKCNDLAPLHLIRTRMILCSECGNKRCPKATDHKLACTKSNDPGQAGSVY